MVNELVARVIVAGRTETAVRAAEKRQLLVAGENPTRGIRWVRRPVRSVWPIRGRPSRTAAAG
jgi:hypothetical protein